MPLLRPPLDLPFACISVPRLPQEWSEAKARQDQQLEGIETGLGHLKEIGAAMNEELQRHDILITEVGAGAGGGGDGGGAAYAAYAAAAAAPPVL